MADQVYNLEFDVDIGDAISAKVAEAWAVGQRGGVDVPEGDPTFENNAKYYAGKTAEDRKSTSEASKAVAEGVAAALKYVQQAEGHANAAEVAKVAAEAAVQEAIAAIVSAQGNDIVRMDENGDFFVYEEE